MDKLYCKYCDKECKNKNSVSVHQRYCKLNPNRHESPFVNYNKNADKKKYKNQFDKANKLGLEKPKVTITHYWLNKHLPDEIKNFKWFEEYKNRDNLKDLLLKENGWEVLRISWKKCFNNPKYYIELANKFIGEEA